MTEPLLSGNQIRVYLASLREQKKTSHGALVHLVQKLGLPKHDDPFGTGRWVFLRSEVDAWLADKLKGDPKPMRGPGRPSKYL